MSDHGLLSPRSLRFYMASLLMLAFFCTTAMRADLGMAMVCMVNDTALAKSQPMSTLTEMRQGKDECNAIRSNQSIVNPGYQGTFQWNAQQQSLLFSATFWGAVITILPSGFFVDRYGPKWALLFSVAIYSVFTLASPLLAVVGYEWLFFARFMMGFGEVYGSFGTIDNRQGFAIPSISAMVVRWFPVAERSTVSAMYTSGNQLAGLLTTLGSAELCASKTGWPAIFYLLGTIGTVWCILWLIFATNTPNKHCLISANEQNYLQKEMQSVVSRREFRNLPMPWRKMFTSPPVYANIVAMFVMDFGDTIMISFLPTFFKEVLQLDVQLNGVFTAVPFVIQLITKNLMALLADWLKSRAIISNTTSCKLFQSIASFGGVGAFLALGTMVNCTTPFLALTLLIAFAIVNAGLIPGSLTSMISITPVYTGTLFSIYQAFGTIAGVISPILVGYLNTQNSLDEWQRIFLMTAIVYFIGGVVFLFFGSGNVQPWAQHHSRIYIDTHPTLILGDPEVKSDKLLLDSI